MIYSFIGLGNMAGAILRGMVQCGHYQHDTLTGYDSSEAALSCLQKDVGLQPLKTVQEAAEQADVLVLCVKPQVMPEILDNIKNNVRQETLVITIAAGLHLSFYESRLPAGTAIIRTMPSLNAMVMAASSALCKNEHVGIEQAEWGQTLLSSIGRVHEIPEALFPAFSAIAGAAPAFAFQFADALAQSGVQAGLSRQLAQETAAEMLFGSGKLLMSSHEHPRVLMDKVTSPGGTTIEGVHKLDEFGFTAALHAAVKAVIEKDKLLGKEHH